MTTPPPPPQKKKKKKKNGEYGKNHFTCHCHFKCQASDSMTALT